MFETTERRSIAERRADATREAVLEAAWELSRTHGLTGWSMRQLAETVGLKAPTVYAYFASKDAIYDAMFRQAYEALESDEHAISLGAHESPREAWKIGARRFFRFCVDDPTRFQLMFQRTIPGFEPSPEAYAASERSYQRYAETSASVGVTDPGHLDLWTAMISGLTSQQISNDPSGDRWERLVDTAVDLFCDHVGIS